MRILQTGEVAIRSKTPEDVGEVVVIGVDIGKDTFHLVGFDGAGQRVLREKIRRLLANSSRYSTSCSPQNASKTAKGAE